MSAPTLATLAASASDASFGLPRPRRLHQFLERSADAAPSATALEVEGRTWTYAALDALANQLAHRLGEEGVGPGDTVGIMIERSLPMYVAILGALKAGATYVPIDPNAPHDRVGFILGDAGVRLLLTASAVESATEGHGVERIFLDDLAAAVADRPSTRVDLLTDDDPVAYVIYTSGSTGLPKGVMVAHSSICNFIAVASVCYDVQSTDRVYQGMSVSFDFSLEELWTTWATGATLVAGPTDGRKVGAGLADFLDENRITFMHAVPTVLSTLDRTLPRIRTLNLGGEACPPELVERWGSHGRRILNTYGPTECTASCTWAELHPGEPVTIGKALPTYGATLRDPDTFAIVPDGEVGELCITGVGVAVGYVGRPDLTAEKFVRDEEGRRTYKTGDLGRFDANGNIVYLGRKDAEVKIRGHRVDLGEIEGVLLEDRAVSTAVLTKRDSDAGGDLVAYVLTAGGRPGNLDLANALHDHARRRLPPYMVPDYIEFVDSIPLMPSGKPDRRALPDPVHPRLIAAGEEYRAPETPTEERVLDVWASVMNLPAEQVSTRADLFTDLGGHSLVAATLVSTLRRSGLPGTASLSIPELYAHPTIARLAAHLDAGANDAPLETVDPAPTYSGGRSALFGVLQFLSLYVTITLSMLPLALLYAVHDGRPSLDMLGQLALLLPFSYLFVRWLMPVATARVLAPGVQEGTFPLYGAAHLRVWLIQRAVSMSPLPHLAGTPWANGYLRALGGEVAEDSYVGTAVIPLPSLVSIGANVSVGYATHLRGFEVLGGRLHIGRVRVERDATVASNCVLTGPCTVGAGAALQAQSLIVPGTEVPGDQVWAGSPAEPGGEGDPALATMQECLDAPRTWSTGLRRRFLVGIATLELLPMLAMLPAVVLVWMVLLALGDVAALVATLATGPLFVATICALILVLRRFAVVHTPVGVHHLRSELGLEKWFGDRLLEASLVLVNQLYGTLYTAHWLRAMDARIGRHAEIATIANIDPDLLTLGDGSFVADMASVGSASYANGHVAFRRTVVEARAFVGNASYIPSGTRLAPGSLIGVLSRPPTRGAGPGTSWLGSPPMFLPQREIYDEFSDEATFAPPRAKVAARYVIEFVRIILPPTLLALSTYGALWSLAFLARSWPWWALLSSVAGLALAGSLAVTLVVAALKWIVVGRYRKRVEPLWGGFVRRTEFITGVFETTAVPVLLNALRGTPMLGPLLRLFGVHVGRRTLIDTTYVTEFDLVHIGDDVSVGADASLQTHLFEDRVMKMDVVQVENRASIASRAVVLYGSSVGEDARVHALTLIMKGEELPARTRWEGIPARPPRRRGDAPTAPVHGELPPYGEAAPALFPTFAQRVGVPRRVLVEDGVAADTTAALRGLDSGPRRAIPVVEDEVVPGRAVVQEVDLVDVPHTPPQAPPLRRVTESRQRVAGVDVARGLALLGMMVVHIVTGETDEGTMDWSWRLASGNAAALFALLAGVGIAFATGRDKIARRGRWASDAASVAVRAVLIGLIGLVLGTIVPTDVANVILPYYAVLFLLALPFLRVPAGWLIALSLAAAVIVPIGSHVLRRALPVVDPQNLSFASVFAEPVLTVQHLLLTGVFPALAWMTYLLAGLGIGRLHLRRWVAVWLIVAGTALAAGTQLVNWIVLHPLDGLQSLADVASRTMTLDDFTGLLVWGADGTLPTTSWWWLAVLAPHTTTPFDLLFTLGVAVALLGTCLVVSETLGVSQLLAVIGSMPLTMYTLHLLMTTVVPDATFEWGEYAVQAVLLFAFAWVWRRNFPRGPLEGLINVVVVRVRRALAPRGTR